MALRVTLQIRVRGEAWTSELPAPGQRPQASPMEEQLLTPAATGEGLRKAPATVPLLDDDEDELN